MRSGGGIKSLRKVEEQEQEKNLYFSNEFETEKEEMNKETSNKLNLVWHKVQNIEHPVRIEWSTSSLPYMSYQRNE